MESATPLSPLAEGRRGGWSSPRSQRGRTGLLLQDRYQAQSGEWPGTPPATQTAGRGEERGGEGRGIKQDCALDCDVIIKVVWLILCLGSMYSFLVPQSKRFPSPVMGKGSRFPSPILGKGSGFPSPILGKGSGVPQSNTGKRFWVPSLPLPPPPPLPFLHPPPPSSLPLSHLPPLPSLPSLSRCHSPYQARKVERTCRYPSLGNRGLSVPQQRWRPEQPAREKVGGVKLHDNHTQAENSKQDKYTCYKNVTVTIIMANI